MTEKFTNPARKRIFWCTISMYVSAMKPLCTHVGKLVTSNFQICFLVPYLSLHAKYCHMPNMTQGRTSPGLPCELTPKEVIVQLSCHRFWSIGYASDNSVESYNSVEAYLGRTSRIYFDNVTLALHNVTLTS